ncbi:MAG: hypothetical protein ACLTTZ_06270 [Lachnospiraceae bacterium]
MTANIQDLRNTLEAQNFQDEQILNKENRKTLHKMMKYVRTFPLKSIEIEQIRRDLTGMAIEAQQRGTSLQAMLGENPRKFCDEIIYSIGGIKAPGGRKLLHIAGCYYQIIGAMSIVCDLISIFALLIIAAGSLLNTGEPDLRIMDLLSVFWSLAIAIFHYQPGKSLPVCKYITKPTCAPLGNWWLRFDFIVNLPLSLKQQLPRP